MPKFFKTGLTIPRISQPAPYIILSAFPICLVYLPFSWPPSNGEGEPTLSQSWMIIRRCLGLSSHHSLYQPFLGNPSLQNGKPHPIFCAWSARGITLIGDLTENITQPALSFSQTSIKFAFLNAHFFHFLLLQLHSAVSWSLWWNWGT